MKDDTTRQLGEKLDEARIKHDSRGGTEVSYLEGYDIINAANRIFGFDGWSYEVLTVGIAGTWTVKRRRNNAEVEVEIALYQAKVAVDVGGVRRIDVGTNITSVDTADAHETSLKGAVTDGLKRALRTFGEQFGNGLYEKPGNRNQQQRPSERREPNAPPRTAPPARPAPPAQPPVAAAPQPAEPEPEGPLAAAQRAEAKGEKLIAATPEWTAARLDVYTPAIKKVLGRFGDPRQGETLAAFWKAFESAPLVMRSRNERGGFEVTPNVYTERELHEVAAVFEAYAREPVTA